MASIPVEDVEKWIEKINKDTQYNRVSKDADVLIGYLWGLAAAMRCRVNDAKKEERMRAEGETLEARNRG